MHHRRVPLPDILLACTMAITAATAAPAQSPAPTARQWRADLAFLARTLPERHPKPFGTITRERWLTAVAALDAGIPSLPPHAIAVGFARVVALIGDAHTVAHAAGVPPGFHSLPIRLYWFADGLHVIAATRGREALLGLRLTRVGATPVDSAVRVVARTFVGEPTGGRPNHFGETRSFTLPNSGMTIQHSTKYFRQQAKDEDALYPDVRVEVRATDYAAGRDPVMEEVRRRIGAGR